MWQLLHLFLKSAQYLIVYQTIINVCKVYYSIDHLPFLVHNVKYIPNQANKKSVS